MTKTKHDCCTCRKKAKEMNNFYEESDKIDELKAKLSKNDNNKSDVRSKNTRWKL
jgi:hypothetical protein